MSTRMYIKVYNPKAGNNSRTIGYVTDIRRSKGGAIKHVSINASRHGAVSFPNDAHRREVARAIQAKFNIYCDGG